MGQKTNPIGFRLGIVDSWRSTWFAPRKTFGGYLIEDIKIRRVLDKELSDPAFFPYPPRLTPGVRLNRPPS